jgi:hypothetical protein
VVLLVVVVVMEAGGSANPAEVALMSGFSQVTLP